MVIDYIMGLRRTLTESFFEEDVVMENIRFGSRRIEFNLYVKRDGRLLKIWMTIVDRRRGKKVYRFPGPGRKNRQLYGSSVKPSVVAEDICSWGSEVGFNLEKSVIEGKVRSLFNKLND